MYHVPYGVSLLLGLIAHLDHYLIMIKQLVFRLAGLVEVGVSFCFPSSANIRFPAKLFSGLKEEK